MNFTKFSLAAILAVLATAAQAQVGSVGFSNPGPTTAFPSGDINTATSYTLGDMLDSFQYNADGTGAFAGLPSSSFGSITFSPSSPFSVNFSDSVFGSFQSTSIQLASESPGTITYDVFGTYNSGNFDGGTIVGDPASLTINFVQNPADTGVIVADGVFSVPPVPEPGTLALLGLGVSAVCVQLRRRNV